VLEDRALLAQAAGEAPRGFLASATAATRFGLRQALLWSLGRWHRFGYACVNFGTPVSMRAWSAARALDWRTLDPAARSAWLGELGQELMQAVARVIPALPVSLLATALLEGDAARPVSPLELHARTQALMRRLGAAGAHVYLPRDDEEYAVGVGLRMLVQRRLVEEREGGWVAVPEELPVLRYYAAAIAPQLETARSGEAVSTAQA
jgi:glycerol-3-phosphate O-acyltransferase